MVDKQQGVAENRKEGQNGGLSFVRRGREVLPSVVCWVSFDRLKSY